MGSNHAVLGLWGRETTATQVPVKSVSSETQDWVWHVFAGRPAGVNLVSSRSPSTERPVVRNLRHMELTGICEGVQREPVLPVVLVERTL